MPRVIAVCCADIHLSEKVPAARSAEPDWPKAMGRYFDQLIALSEDEFAVPILCGGDVFDRWSSGPSLINWAIGNIPTMHAVPGQHDIPYHSLEELTKSAYWTLVETGRIVPLNWSYGEWLDDGILAFGFPWGKELEAPREGLERLAVAVAHKTIWKGRPPYPGAPPSGNVQALKGRLDGYDAAVFGDNHRPFEARIGDCNVFNCGCLIPRKMDERGIVPSVGLLREDGTFERRCLDVSDDRWCEDELAEAEGFRIDVSDFLDELGSLEASVLDFRGVMERFMRDKGLSDRTKRIVLEAMG